jgi:ABC-2 type transport system ATP-binding protein
MSIRACNLTKTYGNKTVVNDLSFDVLPGVVTGFLGPNGAGKSTTMRLILGLDIADSGAATINGKRIHDFASPMREVGVLLDASYLHPTRTAHNHLWALAVSNGIAKERVGEVLALVGLSEVSHQRVGTFSLGMKQRIGLAAALLGDPGVIILDEPANGLDPEGVHWIRNFLSKLADEGRTVFVSSHLLAEMALIAEQLVVIGAGKLITQTSLNEVTNSASGSSVYVRSPQIEVLKSALLHAGATVVDSGVGISVTGWEEAQIGRFAFDQRCEIHELSTRTPTLEEAFLELTASSQQYRTLATTGTHPQGS